LLKDKNKPFLVLYQQYPEANEHHNSWPRCLDVNSNSIHTFKISARGKHDKAWHKTSNFLL